ncbi:hypothetical protein TYRP_021969 [Tyrophagus putrescentiae]|nr:hypothetical protein TYRP_021969 [Tyrophagus putrescentiae]
MQCDEEFGDQGSLNAHNLKKHQTQIYSCPLQMCNKSFKFLNELAGHAKQHSNVASWDCYVCSFNGLDMDELSKHLSQEHENGKFRCIKEGCSVVSSTRADAERHFTSGNHISSQNANDAGQPDEDDDEQEASSSDFQNSNFPSIFMNGKKFRIDSIKCFNENNLKSMLRKTTATMVTIGAALLAAMWKKVCSSSLCISINFMSKVFTYVRYVTHRLTVVKRLRNTTTLSMMLSGSFIHLF